MEKERVTYIRYCSILLIAVMFILGIYLYNTLPDDKIPTHWNAQGEADNYSSKSFGLFFMPALALGLFLFFLVLQKIDPLRENVEKFRKIYEFFILAILLLLFYIYFLSIIYINNPFNFVMAIVPAFVLLFLYIGSILPKLKRNWFIGIRTPWTISSEKSWEKTHRLGGVLFKLCGAIGLLGIIFQELAIWFVLIPVFASAIITIIYSYIVFKKK